MPGTDSCVNNASDMMIGKGNCLIMILTSGGNRLRRQPARLLPVGGEVVLTLFVRGIIPLFRRMLT